MNPIDHKALLALWNLDEIPACDKGMELAQAFLVSAGEGVDRLGVEEPEDRLAEITAAYMALVEHGAGCDDCNEADDLPERDDVPIDPHDNDTEFLADRKVGFRAGSDGAEFIEWQTEGWKRGGQMLRSSLST